MPNLIEAEFQRVTAPPEPAGSRQESVSDFVIFMQFR